ncbi:hypothetical protein QR98_0079760 [Sarcoptes scabiei]|uniref:Uncharacterized protein n=1 Tax=Sarcoptes scabiei TaxID=52283 RepID=A0A132AG65_SARSC|nr:hypothetical protein QR98_0079760 [Sarcoptes scabiei]
MSKIILFALIAAIIATILSNQNCNVEAARKGNDIIILGGYGWGGYPSFISSGSKKKGSIIFLGRRKRSILDSHSRFALIAK